MNMKDYKYENKNFVQYKGAELDIVTLGVSQMLHLGHQLSLFEGLIHDLDRRKNS